MTFHIDENGRILCRTNSDYYAFTLDTNGDIYSLSPKGVFHCEAKDLIDLGRKVEELQGASHE